MRLLTGHLLTVDFQCLPFFCNKIMQEERTLKDIERGRERKKCSALFLMVFGTIITMNAVAMCIETNCSNELAAITNCSIDDDVLGMCLCLCVFAFVDLSKWSVCNALWCALRLPIHSMNRLN